MSSNHTTDLAIRIIKNSSVTPELDRAIREGLVEGFPKDREHFACQRSWHSTPEWVVCAVNPDGTLAAHIAVVERQVTVGPDAIPVDVAGTQGIFVRPPWRKTGLFDRIMDAALHEARNRGLEAGLLFCREVLEDKVYGRLGWKRVNAKVFMENDSGEKVPRPQKDIAMTLPLSIPRFPEGDIDLHGLDW